MKALIPLWTMLMLAILCVLSVQAQTLDAKAILDRVRSAWQGDSFHAVLRLELTLSGQTKSHVLEVWTLKEDYALIRILPPDPDAGAGYLKAKDDLWYYSPDVGMSIKLPAMALGDAIFGAGPSLNDLSHTTLSDDYDATAVADGDRHLLTLIPHTDAPVVYGKLEICVDSDYVIEQIVYYDQRGEVLRTATFSQVIKIGERSFPTEIIVEDASGDRTVERIENPEFDIAIDPSFFTLEGLEEAE
jgi:hypothetical protein